MSLYIRAETSALTDAKLLAVGPLGFALYFKGLMYSKDHLTDGFVPEDALALIGMGIPKLQELVAKMVEKDLWQKAEGGYTVTLRRWEKHQTTKEKVEESRESARIRKERERDRKKAQRDIESKTDQVTDVSQRDASHLSQPVTALSKPEPKPEPEPEPNKEELRSSEQAARSKNLFEEVEAVLLDTPQFSKAGINSKPLTNTVTKYLALLDPETIVKEAWEAQTWLKAHPSTDRTDASRFFSGWLKRAEENVRKRNVTFGHKNGKPKLSVDDAFVKLESNWGKT